MPNITAHGVCMQTMTRCIPHVITRFVLVQTISRGNVGASARAIKTMGFEQLWLVDPNDARVLNRHETKMHASGADHILQTASICASVHAAVEGMEVVCATIMSQSSHPALLLRHQNRNTNAQQNNTKAEGSCQAPRKFFAELVLQKHKEQPLQPIRIAFLFGNEKHGLRAEDIEVCDTILSIPTNPEFGSLNLAAAVQVIAYDWREALGGYPILNSN
jgi:tRNA/rRNA methyltransferase